LTTKQKLALVVPLPLIAVMYPVFHGLAHAFRENWRVAWFLGLAGYWVVWGAAFPILVVGWKQIAAMIRPRRPDATTLLLTAFPVAMAAVFRLLSGMEYDKPGALATLLVLASTAGNGLFEEILWRGVYLKLYRNAILLGVLWPGLWFALWHYVPGSIAPDGHVAGLMIGSGMFGLYLGFLARKTDGLWWCVVAHVLGGIVMVT